MKLKKQMLHNQDVNHFFCEMTQKFYVLTNVYKMSSRENTNMQSNKNIKSDWTVTLAERKRKIMINLSGLEKVIILLYS